MIHIILFPLLDKIKEGKEEENATIEFIFFQTFINNGDNLLLKQNCLTSAFYNVVISCEHTMFAILVPRNYLQISNN